LARFAAEGLGFVGDVRAFAPLAEWWQQGERDLLEFTAALRTLVELDAERLLPLLLKVLPRAPLAQLPAIEAALQRCPGALRRMQPLLHGRDRALQGVAIRVLASSGDARATVELVNAWERDPELRVQLAQAFVTLRAHSLANMLLHALTIEQDGEVRGAIASALRALADARVAREAIRWLPHERDPRTRILLITLAGERGDAEAIPLLVPLLRDLATTPQTEEGMRRELYPANVHVREAAALAILRLRGLSNLPFEKLSRWPMRAITATWPGCEIPALERWWAERAK
jgi:HEAT repeat protein